MTESVAALPLETLDPERNVFALVALDNGDCLECIGTAVAISRNLVLTTWKNGMFRNRKTPCRTYGRNVYLVLQQLPAEKLTFQMSDLVGVNMVQCDEDEEWCVLERATGEFETYCAVCPEHALPHVQDQVTMYDCLLACNAQNGAHTVRQQTNVVRYYYRQGIKRSLASLDSASDDSITPNYEQVNVASDGSDIYNSECSPLEDVSGRVFALYTAHFNYMDRKYNGRHAQMLSRLQSFKSWYKATFPEIAI